MDGKKIRPGQHVNHDGHDWEVLDRAPTPATWYLHRNDADGYRTTTAHARALTFISNGAREPEKTNA